MSEPLQVVQPGEVALIQLLEIEVVQMAPVGSQGMFVLVCGLDARLTVLDLEFDSAP